MSKPDAAFDTPLILDPDTGWFRGCRHCPSPNFDARPGGTLVDLLVVHAISLPAGSFGGPSIEQLFLNRLDHSRDESFRQLVGLRVSAHFLIRRNGELVQFVSTRERAWHAGVSRFENRERCNDFSLGVELEGCDDQPFTSVQYDVLLRLASVLRQSHPAITPARIVGHADIAPGRKTDPGPHFDWGRVRAALA